MSTPMPVEFPSPLCGSKAVLERRADGLIVTIPPESLRRGGGCLFWWAMLWNAMLLPPVAIAALMCYQAFTGTPIIKSSKGVAPTHVEVLMFCLYLVPFVLIGAVMLLVVRNLGRRRATLRVSGQRLLVVYTGLLKTRCGEWSRDEIAAICAGSGSVQGLRVQLQLEVHPKIGAKFALLVGRPDAELKWLAEVLRQALGIGAEPLSLLDDDLRTEGEPDEPVGQAPAAPGADEGEGAETSVVQRPTPTTARGCWLFGLIFYAIFGAVVLTTIYFMVNQMSSVNRVGWIQRQGWPWSSVYLWAAAGALLAVVGALLGRVGAVLGKSLGQKYARQLEAVAQRMDFAYYRDFLPETWDEVAIGMRFFRPWGTGEHHMTGRIGDLSVDMLDYTYFVTAYGGGHTSGSPDTKASSSYSQTVILLPAPESGLPAFELLSRHPRHLVERFLGLASVEGITFSAEKAAFADDRHTTEYFNRHYLLSGGLDTLPEQMLASAQSEDRPTAEQEAREVAVQQLFTLEVIRFFAEHPGWSAESDGKHLALWRRGKIVPAAGREQLLADAMEVYQTLAGVWLRQRQGKTVASVRPDPLVGLARLIGTHLGLFLGFVAGFILAMIGVFWRYPSMPDAPVMAAMLFGGAVLGLIPGPWLGRRLLCRPILFILRARRRKVRGSR